MRMRDTDPKKPGYSPEEMPPDPKSGRDQDARDQRGLERQRAAERERSRDSDGKPNPQGS